VRHCRPAHRDMPTAVVLDEICPRRDRQRRSQAYDSGVALPPDIGQGDLVDPAVSFDRPAPSALAPSAYGAGAPGLGLDFEKFSTLRLGDLLHKPPWRSRRSRCIDTLSLPFPRMRRGFHPFLSSGTIRTMGLLGIRRELALSCPLLILGAEISDAANGRW
jgi:hypothetical protein